MRFAFVSTCHRHLYVYEHSQTKCFTESTNDQCILLMCLYGKDKLYNLGVDAKQNNFKA